MRTGGIDVPAGSRGRHDVVRRRRPRADSRIGDRPGDTSKVGLDDPHCGSSKVNGGSSKVNGRGGRRRHGRRQAGEGGCRLGDDTRANGADRQLVDHMLQHGLRYPQVPAEPGRASRLTHGPQPIGDGGCGGVMAERWIFEGRGGIGGGARVRIEGQNAHPNAHPNAAMCRWRRPARRRRRTMRRRACPR